MPGRIRLLLAESWRGQRRLYKVFWLYYVLGAFAAGLSLLLFVQFAALFPGPIAIALIFAAVAALIVWKIWALVSIWRCAPNSSSSGYKFLGRAYVVCFLLTFPISFLDSVEQFKNYRLRGYDALAKSQIRDAAVAQEVFFTNRFKYTGATTDLHKHGLQPEPKVRIVVVPGRGGLEKTFVIIGRHIESQSVFFFDSTTGKINETTLDEARQAGLRGLEP